MDIKPKKRLFWIIIVGIVLITAVFVWSGWFFWRLDNPKEVPDWKLIDWGPPF